MSWIPSLCRLQIEKVVVPVVIPCSIVRKIFFQWDEMWKGVVMLLMVLNWRWNLCVQQKIAMPIPNFSCINRFDLESFIIFYIVSVDFSDGRCRIIFDWIFSNSMILLIRVSFWAFLNTNSLSSRHGTVQCSSLFLFIWNSDLLCSDL